MGVPLFYQRIIHKHFSAAVNTRKPRCTTLALDFAGIEHNVYNYMLENYDIWTVNDYLHRMSEVIIDLIQQVGVQRRLIICRDGMAPVGKMANQRRRRYRHAKDLLEKEVNVPFDSNALSPGTEISIQIDNYLNTFISRNVGKNLPPNVIFSGYRVPGEGEHKIIEHLQAILSDEPKKLKELFDEVTRRYQFQFSDLDETAGSVLSLLDLEDWNDLSEDIILERLKVGVKRKYLTKGMYENFEKLLNSSESVLIYGLDADLIFLALPLQTNLYLWRNNEFINQMKYQRFISNNMSEAKAKKLARVVEHTYLNIKKLQNLLHASNIGIEEFIMGGFVFGNDFIPYLPGFNMVSDLADAFIEKLVGRRFAEPFNLIEFQKFIKDFDYLLPHLYGRLTGQIIDSAEKNAVDYPSKLPLDNFEEHWIDRMTFVKSIPENVEIDGEDIDSKEDDLHYYSIHYFKTLIWSYNYYKHHKLVNWEWVYYNYWAPPISALLEVKASEIKTDDILKFQYPNFNIAGQLLLILPRDLKTGEPNQMIPKPLRILQEKFSPVFDFFPTRFNIYLDGVNRIYDGITFLSHFDYLRYLESLKIIHFTRKELDNYSFGNVEVYKSSVVHSSQLEKKEDIETEEEKNYFTVPSKINSLNDFWKRKATELFGMNLMNKVLPVDERHFIEIRPIEKNEIDFKRIKIVRKNF